MIMKYLWVICLLLFTTTYNSALAASNQPYILQHVNPPIFKMVEVPDTLTKPEDRAQFLVTNYWTNFDFSDTTCLAYPDVIEHAFVDYLSILPHTSKEVAVSSLKNMMKKAGAEKKMFTHFFDLCEKYLYDPNSPMLNEEFFIPVLEVAISSTIFDETEKIRPRNLLDLALKNRVGHVANDFTFTTEDGDMQSLSRIDTEYTLLFFHNPGCPACENTSYQLKVSPIITHLRTQQRLTILALYPDENLTYWKMYMDSVTKDIGWINAYDQDLYLREHEVYDLKAIPTLYLLDKDKVVLLKDATFEQIVSYLSTK